MVCCVGLFRGCRRDPEDNLNDLDRVMVEWGYDCGYLSVLSFAEHSAARTLLPASR